MGEKYEVWEYEAEFEQLKLIHLQFIYEFNVKEQEKEKLEVKVEKKQVVMFQ